MHIIIFPYVCLPGTLEKVFCKFSGILESELASEIFSCSELSYLFNTFTAPSSLSLR